MAEQGAPDWIADLGREEGVSRLIRAIALSDRFHVYLLLCERPRVAQAVFNLLPARVAEEREEPVQLVRLDPYERTYGAVEPILIEHLADRILERLVSPAPVEREANVIVVVDGSKALPHDDEAWALLFQRMNERRNVIAGALQGALVVCLPRRLEPVFAHAAPDFWSIRSLAVVVEGAPPPDATRRVLQASESRTPYGEVESEEPSEAAEIEAGIAKARESLTKTPDDAGATEALFVWLERRIQHDIAWGRLDRALRAAEECVVLSRRRLEQAPASVEWLRYLSVSLNNRGNVQLADGDLLAARKSYDESVEVVRRLLEQEPDRAEWLHDLSVSLDNVGDVQFVARENLTAAYEAYDESLKLRWLLLEREPDRMELLRDLSVSLGHIGYVEMARYNLSTAYESYAESLVIMRRLLERDPDRAEWLHDISMILNQVGDLYLLRGDLIPAYEAYVESHGNVRRLLAQSPTRPSFRSDLALSLVRQAWILEVLGRSSDALTFWREALAELKSLSRCQSPLPIWIERTALARKEIARLEPLLAPKPKRSPKKRRSAPRPPRGAA